MEKMMVYKDFFDIDPDYNAVMSFEAMKENPLLWKKFYPHDTFVKLLEVVTKVLNKEAKKSIWVEGAFGTGKTYAILTLKSMLEAGEKEIKDYFREYPTIEKTSNGLCAKFLEAKRGNILTVYRGYSSDITDDFSLCVAIQESIMAALKQKGMEHTGTLALKDAAIKWLSNEPFKDLVNRLLLETKYQESFSGQTVEGIVANLKKYSQLQDAPSQVALIELIKKIGTLGKENGLNALMLNVAQLKQWVQEVIKENNITDIVFIWDEFTDYFQKNMKSLSGFQDITQLSGTQPFYFVIVTHNSLNNLFLEEDRKKIRDRFCEPICRISLPDSTAFRLIGHALKKTNEPPLQAQWQDYFIALVDRTQKSRQMVVKNLREIGNQSDVTQEDICNILPFSPYAALFLKNIAAYFASNQRSMFSFIKEKSQEKKAFAWYIQNFGPEDPQSPLLTIDMLWTYFYETGKDVLPTNVSLVLDSYSRAKGQSLSQEEDKVLKTVLLMQAVTSYTGTGEGNMLDTFSPTAQNLILAFEGLPLEDVVINIANRLCDKFLLDKRANQDGSYTFLTPMNASDEIKVEEEKQKILKDTDTINLINDLLQKEEGQDTQVLEEARKQMLGLDGFLSLRYSLDFADFNNIKKKANSQSEYIWKIKIIAGFAKDDKEGSAITQKIQELLANQNSDIVFVDASATVLGQKGFQEYAQHKAYSNNFRDKDKSQADIYSRYAKTVLKKWQKEIESGDFTVYWKQKQKKVTTKESLLEVLKQIDFELFPFALETHPNAPSLLDTMWKQTNLASGAECGIIQQTKGTFKGSTQNSKLENYIGCDIWGRQGTKYWQDFPQAFISKIKIFIENTIQEALNKTGYIYISDLYEKLLQSPFGFMPCNLSAFVLGFLLKEYATGTYRYSDGTYSVVLTKEHLKDMISKVITKQNGSGPKYIQTKIAKRTPQEEAFCEAISYIFDIPQDQLPDMDVTRSKMRLSLKTLNFPLWCLEYLPQDCYAPLKTQEQTIKHTIELFCGFLNTANINGVLGNTGDTNGTSETQIANDIGSIMQNNQYLKEDLKALIKEENCIKGLENYLKDFCGGELLSLSQKLQDQGFYINILKQKFSLSEAATWAWNCDTINDIINDVITEYKIIDLSNNIRPKTNKFADALQEWQNCTKYIRICFDALKNNVQDNVYKLLECLYSLKTQSSILDWQKKQEFLLSLQQGANDFSAFYKDQKPTFRKVCSFDLRDKSFNEKDIEALFNSFSDSTFEMSQKDYFDMVAAKIKDFDEKRLSTRLLKLWQQNSSSTSPRKWSQANTMPILYMVQEDKRSKAKSIFDLINDLENGKTKDTKEIQEALLYLETEDAKELFCSLKDTQKIQDNFIKSIIKNYSVILKDTNLVKATLKQKTAIDVYDWYLSQEIENLVKDYADNLYKKGGFEEALSKIDTMDATKAKEYLKTLIKDNITVGIEVIKQGQ